MKVLIWIGCALSLGVITTTLNIKMGIYLGLIPTIVLYSTMFWLARTLCDKWDIKTVEKEAFSKGMSIRQYITSVVPPSLIIFCEAHKGEPSVIKKNVKMINDESEVNEDKIPKRILVVLLEMYK